MSHESIRLEATDGTVIAYLAPTFEVTPQDTNDVFGAGRGGDRKPIVRDNGLWTSEIVAQGHFPHSEETRAAHRQALQDLFGQNTVTPLDQVNRLRAMTVYSQPGAVHLYHRGNEYTATSEADLDVANGVYPAVTISELRNPEDGEVSQNRVDFLIRMDVGFERA